jgi:hypothetical protein
MYTVVPFLSLLWDKLPKMAGAPTSLALKLSAAPSFALEEADPLHNDQSLMSHNPVTDL